MNPQNEVYATEGSSIANPNEIKSTVLGLVTALFIGALSYIFVSESFYKHATYTIGFVKVLLISAAYFGSFVLLFFLKVKAFYIDRQEATRGWKNLLS